MDNTIETKIKYNDKVPHNFQDLTKKAELLGKVNHDEMNLNKSVQVLVEHGIPCSTVDELKNISADNVKAYIQAECKKFLSASSFIPVAVVNETKMKYYDAYKELEPDITTVADIVGRYSAVTIDLEDGYFHFNDDSFNTWATEQCTVHITKEIRDAYQAYKELYNAIIKCNQYEKEHGLRDLSIHGQMFPTTSPDMPPITLNIWQLMTGEYLQQPAEEFTPERYIKHFMKYLYK